MDTGQMKSFAYLQSLNCISHFKKINKYNVSNVPLALPLGHNVQFHPKPSSATRFAFVPAGHAAHSQPPTVYCNGNKYVKGAGSNRIFYLNL